MDQQTDVTDVEKPVEEVVAETTEKSVDEIKAEAKAEAESVYKQELEGLETEKRQKDGALKEERRLRKIAEAAVKTDESDDNLSEDKLEKLLEKKLAVRDFNQLVQQTTADPDEQALIKHHYEKSIVKTGNVTADLNMAVAIANQHLVSQARASQAEREQAEARAAGFQGNKSYGRTGKPAYETDPNLKGAAEILRRLGKTGEAAIKYL